MNSPACRVEISPYNHPLEVFVHIPIGGDGTAIWTGHAAISGYRARYETHEPL